MELTDREVFALDKILIQGNEKATAIRVGDSFRGIGGSNPGGNADGQVGIYPLHTLSDRAPLYAGFDCMSLCLHAVVSDVAYLVYETRWQTKVIRVPFGEKFEHTAEVGYDTSGSVWAYLQ